MDYISSDSLLNGSSYPLIRNFQLIDTEIQEAIQKTDNLHQFWGLEEPSRQFLRMMNTMEKIFFINQDENEYYSNQVMVKDYEYWRDSIIASNTRTGFSISISPKTRWVNIPAAKHLEVFEKELKETPSQFIKVFILNDKLCVYMNKQPTLRQMLKLKIMQWIIFKDKIKAPEEHIMIFLHALLNKDANTANKAIKSILERKDFIEHRYDTILKAFKFGASKQLRIIEENIENLQNYITERENELSDLIIQLNDKNTLLAAIQDNPEQDFKPLIKYLSKHPYIKQMKKSGEHKIDLYYEAPIVYFDKYILEKIIDRKTGITKKILQIFEKNEYELMSRCMITFDTENFGIGLNRIGDSSIVGHPHIDRFNCFGNHGQAIRESAKEYDYLGAIEQITQAVLNLNFADTYVINELVGRLSTDFGQQSYATWRHKETKAMLTTKEVLDHYEETEADS